MHHTLADLRSLHALFPLSRTADPATFCITNSYTFCSPPSPSKSGIGSLGGVLVALCTAPISRVGLRGGPLINHLRQQSTWGNKNHRKCNEIRKFLSPTISSDSMLCGWKGYSDKTLGAGVTPPMGHAWGMLDELLKGNLSNFEVFVWFCGDCRFGAEWNCSGLCV